MAFLKFFSTSNQSGTVLLAAPPLFSFFSFFAVNATFYFINPSDTLFFLDFGTWGLHKKFFFKTVKIPYGLLSLHLVLNIMKSVYTVIVNHYQNSPSPCPLLFFLLGNSLKLVGKQFPYTFSQGNLPWEHIRGEIKVPYDFSYKSLGNKQIPQDMKWQGTLLTWHL